MNEKEYKKLKANPYVKDLCVWDSNVFNSKKQDSLWYGDTVVSYIYKDRYEISFRAIGDVRAELKNGNDDMRDKNNSGYFAEWAQFNRIASDKGINRYAIIEDNNWFEVQIWDNKKQDWVDDGINTIIDYPKDFFDDPEEVLKSFAY